VLALVYLHAQSKLDAVGDVQPEEGLTAKLGQTPVVLPTVRYNPHRSVEDTL